VCVPRQYFRSPLNTDFDTSENFVRTIPTPLSPIIPTVFLRDLQPNIFLCFGPITTEHYVLIAVIILSSGKTVQRPKFS
jgi:hypothetical protein